MDLVNLLGYPGGVVPSVEADKKRLKCLIDVSLLIGAHFREDRRVTFGKFGISFIHLLLVCPLFECVFG